MADVPQNIQPNTNPDGSNIYIRTMGQDVQNLNQGGGNFSPGLGAEQKPIDTPPAPVSPSMDDLQKKIQDMATGPVVAPINPSAGYTEVTTNTTISSSMPTPVPEVVPSMPVNSEPVPMNNFGSASPMPTPDPMAFNPMEIPSAPMADTVVNNEPIREMADMSTYVKPKKKITKLLIPLILIVVLVAFYFLLWPKLFKTKIPTSGVPSGMGGLVNTGVTTLKTGTTPTTLPPVLAFSASKGDVINSKLVVDITGAPMLYTSIKKEATTLGTAESIKVLQPTIKGVALTSQEVLYTWLKNVPEALTDDITDEYIMYTYYGAVNPAFGLVFKMKDTDPDVLDAMLLWEKNKALLKDASNLWLFSPKTTTAKLFKEQEVLGAKVRYFAYPGKEAALAYTMIGDKLIITTSLESMTSALDHLSAGNAGSVTTTTKLVIPELPTTTLPVK